MGKARYHGNPWFLSGGCRWAQKNAESAAFLTIPGVKEPTAADHQLDALSNLQFHLLAT